MIKLSIKEWLNLPESMAMEVKVSQFTEKDWKMYEARKNSFDISKVRVSFNIGEVTDSDGIVISRVKSPYNTKTNYYPQRDEQKRYCKECVRIFYTTTNSKMLYCSIDCLTESVLRRQFKEKKKIERAKQRREKRISFAIDTQERKRVSNLLFKKLNRSPTGKEIEKWIKQNP